MAANNGQHLAVIRVQAAIKHGQPGQVYAATPTQHSDPAADL